MSTFPWLLALLVTPLVGAGIVMLLPKNSPSLAKQFGVSAATVSRHTRRIRRSLTIEDDDPRYCAVSGSRLVQPIEQIRRKAPT